MKIIMIQEQEVTTGEKNIQLIYQLLKSQYTPEEGEGDYFGIRIQQYENNGTCKVDDCEVVGVTESYEEAVQLFFMFVNGNVMPVHLIELIDNWQSDLFFHGQNSGSLISYENLGSGEMKNS